MELLGATPWYLRIRCAGEERKVYGELYEGNPPTFRLFRNERGQLFALTDADEHALLVELKAIVWSSRKVRVLGPEEEP